MFFQFEIISNVLVSFFQFISIPMLWVYDRHNYFTTTVRGSTLDVRIGVYGRQIMTSKVDPRTARVEE